MVGSVFAVVESETSSVNELELMTKTYHFFIQAVETAIRYVSIDGVHSLLINAILIEHLHPLLAVLNHYVPVAPWVGERHIQQHLLDLWVQYPL